MSETLDDIERGIRMDRAEACDMLPEWNVWVYRNGNGYDTRAFVLAEDEEVAQSKAEHMVSRVLSGIGKAWLQDGDYEVVVKRLIE